MVLLERQNICGQECGELDETRVLLAEDDPASRRIMTHLLKRSGFRVIVAENGEAALGVLGSSVDVAVIDWMMPGVDGVEVCRRLKAATDGRAYVIMVTSRTEKSDIVHALNEGADDYMTKPVDHDELIARVRAGARVAAREREMADACDELRDEANRDALTGLHNRRYFDDVLRERVTGANAGALALLMMDLDHFKHINDWYGHQAGDEVLRTVGKLIDAEVRRGVDVAARYGGEELAVIAPDTSVFCARELAERIRRRVAELRVCVGEALISVTISVGVAMLDAKILGEPDPAAALVEAADTRLYQAKQAGRNRIAA